MSYYLEICLGVGEVRPTSLTLKMIFHFKSVRVIDMKLF